MGFIQSPPVLGNEFEDDLALRGLLERVLPRDVLESARDALSRMGELSAGDLRAQQLAERHLEPRLVQWDAWGNRVDRIEVTPLWQRAEGVAAREGLVALPYARPYAEHSRIVQFALVHLFTPSSDVYTCPLAMTDGAARTLSDSGNGRLIDHAVPRLTSRDPALFWTSGQWMTETTGGSDVSRTETVGRQTSEGWTLHGRKWFTSAIGAQMALTLARPEGNPAGGKGLALFYLETRDATGRLNGITVDRLKDKLGTRKVPTAELTLEGVTAVPVGELANGVRAIASMLNITRVWNSVAAVSFMRRAIAIAASYSRVRTAFGRPLAELPLHADTLAGLQAEYEAALHLAFHVVRLLGRSEAGLASDDDRLLLRVLTPIAKLTTGKQAVAVVSEAMESLGGAGYMEDTGMPTLLRDAQVLPIWEGTTNVLSLDAMRAMGSDGLPAIERAVARLLATVADPALTPVASRARESLASMRAWFEANAGRDESRLEAGARRFAMTVGRAFADALVAHHAQSPGRAEGRSTAY